MEDSSRAKVDKVMQILQDKKAKDIKVLDIRELSTLSDYFVIATGTSTTHVQAFADLISS